MKKPIPILLLILAGLLVATVAVPVLAGNHEQGRGPATHIIVFNEGVDSVVTARELENVHGVKTELIYRKALLGMSGIVPRAKWPTYLLTQTWPISSVTKRSRHFLRTYLLESTGRMQT